MKCMSQWTAPQDGITTDMPGHSCPSSNTFIFLYFLQLQYQIVIFYSFFYWKYLHWKQIARQMIQTWIYLQKAFLAKIKKKTVSVLAICVGKNLVDFFTFKAENEADKISKKPKGKGQFPWHAVVMSDGSVCGGSLLDSSWVLTTASCVKKYKNYTLYVKHGIIFFLFLLQLQKSECQTGQNRPKS